MLYDNFLLLFLPPFPHPFSHPQRIAALNESGEQRLRLFIEGGGCSGFSYKFELDGEEIDEDDDRVFGHAAYPAAEVVVDDSSYDLLKGCVVDYKEEMMSSSFQVVSNPQAEAGCGCGTSFSMKDE